jgi:hypothetical protein
VCGLCQDVVILSPAFRPFDYTLPPRFTRDPDAAVYGGVPIAWWSLWTAQVLSIAARAARVETITAGAILPRAGRA